MSGVMEQMLAELKEIKAILSQGAVAPVAAPSETPAPAATGDSKPKRGRPAGATKAAETPAPVVQSAASVGGDSSFLDDEPVVEEKVTKEQVRAALVAYHKKTNSEDKTRALLKQYGGVDNLSALPEDKYAAVVKAVAEAAQA